MHLYTNGTWGLTSNILDKASTDQDLFQKLHTLHFQQVQEVSYRGGKAHLYTRIHSSGKSELPLGFEFCCVLYLGTFLYPVGIKSVQDVLRFYQEIDAHPKESDTLTASHLIILQQRVTESLSDLAERLEYASVSNGTMTRLTHALEQLTTTLHTLMPRLRTTVFSSPSRRTQTTSKPLHDRQSPNA